MVSLPGKLNPRYKHGFSYEGKKHPLYTTYYNMMARCYNETNAKYYRYGGRGITVCESWKNDKINFFNWALSTGWTKGMTIDREDYDKNYCPENCRWLTLSDNSRSKSTTKLSMLNAKVIRERHANGESVACLAITYHVSKSNITAILDFYTHVEFEGPTKMNTAERKAKMAELKSKSGDTRT